MRYAGVGVKRNTFEPSKGLIGERTARVLGAALAVSPCAGVVAGAGVCIDAGTTSAARLKPRAPSALRVSPTCPTCPTRPTWPAWFGLSVTRGRDGFVTLAAS